MLAPLKSARIQIENVCMIEQKQQFRHDPDNGNYGDCFRTGIACLLGVVRDDVPHVSHDGVVGADAYRRMNDWLAERGLELFSFVLPGEIGVEGALKFCGRGGVSFEYLLGGGSANGTDHVVVCKGDRIVWDPAIDDSGIIAPAGNGHFLVIAIVVAHRDSPLKSAARVISARVRACALEGPGSGSIPPEGQLRSRNVR